MSRKTKAKKIINKIAETTLNILLILVSLLIIIGIYYLFQIKILHNAYANILGYTFFEVGTGSMADTIEIGDVVVVKITKDAQENDIIVYQEEDNFITHRLVKINENGEWITKGDANNTEDSPIQETQVLGKVTQIIPELGIWRRAILSPQVLILATILIILLGIAFKLTTNPKEKVEK